jgi:hypothetical protein
MSSGWARGDILPARKPDPDIERAAVHLIELYGAGAAGRAAARARLLREEGMQQVSRVWQEIVAAIEAIDLTPDKPDDDIEN